MNLEIVKGFSFGLTTGIITTLGMIVGLDSATHSRFAVIAGIVSVGIADAFSDALGMHISEESELKHTRKEIWTATLFTFFAKIIFASLFIVPFLLLDLTNAVYASVAIGLAVLAVFNYFLSKEEKKNPLEVIGSHILIAIIVIIATHYVGHIVNWIASL